MKIGFITCVNDRAEYSESVHYINRLKTPLGFEKILIPIYNASSMCAGYNQAMRQADCDLYVFLHQDTYILNQDFISALMSVFSSNNKIGIIGCTGNSDIYSRKFMDYDRGKVFHHGGNLLLDIQPGCEPFYPVDIVDGFIFAARYNIKFREDIFTGWDFYDLSACMEYKRQGYITAVIGQNTPFTYHANTFSDMTNYYTYEERFYKEYFPEKHWIFDDGKQASLDYSNMQKKTLEIVKELFNSNSRNDLYSLFKSDEFRNHGFLKEAEAITDIDYLEQNTKSTKLLWEDNLSYEDVSLRFKNLRRLMKRIEYDAYDTKDPAEEILSNYSDFAIIEVYEKYIYDKNKIKKVFKNIDFR